MALPKLSESQIKALIRQVAEYIETRRHNYGGKATLLNADQKAVMTPFFPQSILDSTRVVVLIAERVSNPGFYGDLVAMGFEPGLLPDITQMAAITFVDTVVFHEPIENRRLFHELVHVVQYNQLGLLEFSAKYVNGFLTGGSYETIPLERNAYELNDRFDRAPADAFSVEDEVQEWMDWGLF